MTVKELIDQLGKFDPETQVVCSVMDHTDWGYKLPINEIEQVTHMMKVVIQQLIIQKWIMTHVIMKTKKQVKKHMWDQKQQ